MPTAQPGARHPLTELIHVQRNPEAPRHTFIRHTTILGVLTRHDRMLYSRARQKVSRRKAQRRCRWSRPTLDHRVVGRPVTRHRPARLTNASGKDATCNKRQTPGNARRNTRAAPAARNHAHPMTAAHPSRPTRDRRERRRQPAWSGWITGRRPVVLRPCRASMSWSPGRLRWLRWRPG